MKNSLFTLFLACVILFSLSVNTFAEGEIPIGGISSTDTQADDATTFKTVIDYLAQLFG